MSKNITVYQYFQPTGTISLKRQNDFEAPTTLAFNGTYAVVNNQNTIKSVKYRYGETIAARDAASWTDITAKATISGGKVTIPAFSIGSFTINKTYEFQVQIADDKNTVTIARTLTQGIPILSIGNNGRVGVNCLPTDSATTSNTSTRLQVDGAVKAYSFNGMRGIATSLATNSDEYAASSKLTNSLNNSLTNMGKTLFPVGSIFFTTVNKNPGTFIGGTWVAWGSGRVPVGINTSDSNFNTVEKTGGAKTVNLSHSHTVNSHSHVQTVGADDNLWYMETGFGTNGSGVVNREKVLAVSIAGMGWKINNGLARLHHTLSSSPGTSSSLGSAQSILQPYITCYMWKRTA